MPTGLRDARARHRSRRSRPSSATSGGRPHGGRRPPPRGRRASSGRSRSSEHGQPHGLPRRRLRTTGDGEVEQQLLQEGVDARSACARAGITGSGDEGRLCGPHAHAMARAKKEIIPQPLARLAAWPRARARHARLPSGAMTSSPVVGLLAPIQAVEHPDPQQMNLIAAAGHPDPDQLARDAATTIGSSAALILGAERPVRQVRDACGRETMEPLPDDLDTLIVIRPGGSSRPRMPLRRSRGSCTREALVDAGRAALRVSGLRPTSYQGAAMHAPVPIETGLAEPARRRWGMDGAVRRWS